jgi:hypothetical protein
MTRTVLTHLVAVGICGERRGQSNIEVGGVSSDGPHLRRQSHEGCRRRHVKVLYLTCVVLQSAEPFTHASFSEAILREHWHGVSGALRAYNMQGGALAEGCTGAAAQQKLYSEAASCRSENSG